MYKLGRGEVIVEKLKRLTEMTTSGGWAAKIGPEVLASVLSQLPKNENNNKEWLICYVKIVEKMRLM